MAASVRYISAGANRQSHAADSHPTRPLVAFGAGPRVLLWDPSSGRGPHRSLAGHKSVVTVVRFLDGLDSFVSGDTSGEVRVWRGEACATVIAGRGASVSALASLRVNGGHLLVVGSSDARLDVYLLADGATVTQRIDLADRLPLDVVVARLPGSDALVLAVASTDTKLRLLVAKSSAEPFAPVLTLDGHTDWLRALAFSRIDGDLLLASGSQDGLVRLWRIGPVAEALAARSLLDAPEGAADLVMRSRRFVADGRNFACTSEAVLQGHDGWVTDLHFEPHPTPSSPPRLLSTASDNSLIVWSLDASLEHALWLPASRLGDLASGGAALGFFGALWSADGRGRELVLAHGWNGSMHGWRAEDGEWTAIRAISGHSREVPDIVWEPRGEYLLSISSDMSTRLHGSVPAADGVRSWHELARPQVHGYEGRSVVFLGSDRLSIVSVADESVVRTLEAPAQFVQAMAAYDALTEALSTADRPDAAVMPPLGLSSKAVERSDAVTPVPDRLPLEEDLALSTLWPETDKLYGHAFELRAIASTRAGDLIATASAASSEQHAAIRLRAAPTSETKLWRDVGSPLPGGHSLSVTRLRFSPDPRGMHLLSVSRDRGWRLYRRDDVGMGYTLAASSVKAHARIIWDCAWSSDGSVFATASRDRTLKLWAAENGEWVPVATLQLGEPVTAVDIAPRALNGREIMAVGVESGRISLFAWPTGQPSGCALLYALDDDLGHTGAVHRLGFCPRDSEVLRLASAGDDRAVRIVDLQA